MINIAQLIIRKHKEFTHGGGEIYSFGRHSLGHTYFDWPIPVSGEEAYERNIAFLLYDLYGLILAKT